MLISCVCFVPGHCHYSYFLCCISLAAVGSVLLRYEPFTSSSRCTLRYKEARFYAYPIILICCTVESSSTNWKPPSVQTGFRLTASVHIQLSQVGGFNLVFLFYKFSQILHCSGLLKRANNLNYYDKLNL